MVPSPLTATLLDWLASVGDTVSTMSGLQVFWITVGFVAQILFTSRFLVQWLASEKKGESVIPVAFWYLSLSGGLMLFSYACYRLDPVFITGQAFGVVVYVRNLVLIHRKRGMMKAGQTTESVPSVPLPPNPNLPVEGEPAPNAGRSAA